MTFRKVSIFIFVATAFCAQSAFADRWIVCTARGNSLSQQGGRLLPAGASLTFTESHDRNGLRQLSGIYGWVMTGRDGDQHRYIGRFRIGNRTLTENPNYRPSRYRGYSQFKNFDATDATGSAESGSPMAGEFLLENLSSGPRLRAHYVFQAGDHMGGTLHLSCEARVDRR